MDGEAEEIHLTYEELDRQARAIGAWLQAFGATGERALLLFPPGLEYIAAFFGCLYAGVIAVPAYPPRSNRHLDRLRAIVVDAQATIVLTQASLLSKRAPSCVQALDLRELRWLATDRLPNGIADHWREPDVSGETLAFLQYTSGSTSTPKGVMVSHANILHNEQAIQSRLQSREKITGVTWLPPYHDMGLIGGVIHPLYVGFPAIILSPLAAGYFPLPGND
jgi:acyl-CoA synthetase (AMP-forming)/AMP-acid ligase II